MALDSAMPIDSNRRFHPRTVFSIRPNSEEKFVLMNGLTTWKRLESKWLVPILIIMIWGPLAWSQDSPLAPSTEESKLLQEAPATENRIQSSQPASKVFDGIGMSEVLELGIRNNPELQILKATVKASQMHWLAEGLLPNPQVTGGAKKVSGDSSGPVVEFSQEIPFNGSLRMERESARLGYRAQEALALRETQRILNEIQIRIVELLYAKTAEEVENENLRITTDSYNLVSNRFESGLIPELPLSLARAEKGTADNSTQLARREVKIQRGKLAVLLGLTEPELPLIGGSLDTTILPPSLREDGLDREDLRAKELEVQSARADVEAARRSRVPNPVLGYAREEAGNDTENFFTLSLEIPIWNSGRPEVEKRHAEYEVSRKEKESLEKTVFSERSLASRELEERKEAVDRYRTEILPAIQESLAVAGASFKSGKTDLSLLLQTQTRLVGIKREALKAIKDLRLAELNYLFALGLPTTIAEGR